MNFTYKYLTDNSIVGKAFLAAFTIPVAAVAVLVVVAVCAVVIVVVAVVVGWLPILSVSFAETKFMPARQLLLLLLLLLLLFYMTRVRRISFCVLILGFLGVAVSFVDCCIAVVIDVAVVIPLLLLLLWILLMLSLLLLLLLFFCLVSFSAIICLSVH